MGEWLHADEKAAALPGTAGKPFDVGINLFPAPKVEIADAEVGVVGGGDGILKGGEEGVVDVVEY